MKINTRRCIVCKRPRDTVYFHIDKDTGGIWCYCKGLCQRGYSLYAYCHAGGITVSEFLKNEIDFKESKPNEVTRQEWPRSFIPLSDPRAAPGVDYIQNKRGLKPGDEMYYDVERNGIVFPYFFQDVFVGAQIRFIEPYMDVEGHTRKIDTMPGTRLGLIFLGWPQNELMSHVKGVIVVEGAFDMHAIQQTLYEEFNGPMYCPWKVIACSGSGVSQHQLEQLQDLVKKGYKVIIAPDSDVAGLSMYKKVRDAAAATHYAFTGKTGFDWNEALQEIVDTKEYIKWFFQKVKNVE